MRVKMTGFILGGLLLLSCPVSAQICGDANGDGQVNISDLTTIIDYIAHPDYYSPGDFHSVDADCDGNAGVTMSDAVTIIDYMFKGDDHRDCSASGTYSLTPSEGDTVFIPYLSQVPAEINEFALPIMASLTSTVSGVYVPLYTGPDATEDRYDLTGINGNQESGVIVTPQYSPDSDSCSLGIFELLPGALAGERVTYFELNFTRYAAGSGDIAPSEYVRSPLWRITVERDGDLFIPVIVYYSVTLPDPVITVAPTSLSFSAVSGETSGSSLEISFTSTERPVTFDLDLSESWIVLDGDPVGPFTTPVSFWVSADAVTLFPGAYTGTITPVNLDPGEAVLLDGVVHVDFTVAAPLDLPWGDLNCDGRVSLSDVSLLVDCLYIYPRPVPDCR